MIFCSHLNWMKSHIFSRHLVERSEMDSASGNSTKSSHPFSSKVQLWESSQSLGQGLQMLTSLHVQNLHVCEVAQWFRKPFQAWAVNETEVLQSSLQAIDTLWNIEKQMASKNRHGLQLRQFEDELRKTLNVGAVDSNVPARCSIKSGKAFSSRPPSQRHFSLENFFIAYLHCLYIFMALTVNRLPNWIMNLFWSGCSASRNWFECDFFTNNYLELFIVPSFFVLYFSALCVFCSITSVHALRRTCQIRTSCYPALENRLPFEAGVSASASSVCWEACHEAA